ncbi:hypothetical protein F5B22DRAFT_658990 [Xylaria bambusicola]|uniref:uncharacterized protein n=1 Tax=Xylaria bambusicola TaxID=326684 RepID=UPI0020082A30|nr:uncharacterized protein F5B22DRAFT_658990 [Xylaria bambusicola]KAI0508698.1 hypothetical protein F5B22DRAFT_658990 [Xylaria bambusicola]
MVYANWDFLQVLRLLTAPVAAIAIDVPRLSTTMPPRRRPFRARQPDAGTPADPIFGRATILDNGLIGEKPRSKTQLERSRHVPNPKDAELSIYTLNTLQLRRDQPLEALNVQQPIEYLRDNLPEDAKKLVGIARCGDYEIFDCEHHQLAERISQEYYLKPEFWETFRRSEYVFWPIEAERGYFVTAIFHMSNDGDGLDRGWDRSISYNMTIDAWSIVDGQRGEDAQIRLNHVKKCIEDILELQGFGYGDDAFMMQNEGGEHWNEPWVPPPTPGEEHWASGIRAFALVRQLMQRVLDTYCSKGEYSEDFFRKPTCGWLNVDQVRYEMMGICAMNTIMDMDWNARIAIECIERIDTVEGLEPFRTELLAADDDGKAAYIPEYEPDGNPIAV